MKNYQKDLISLLLATEALSFGNFTLKSGRKSPYFINTGKFSSGSSLSKLGSFYARHLVEEGLDDASCLFGPAYKGIPLAAAAATSLYSEYNRDIQIRFDRKEPKDHGEQGKLVGGALAEKERVVIVEDVITAGTTIKEIVPFLRSLGKIEILAIVILVDRCERGGSRKSALQEMEEVFNLRISPMLTIYTILEYLTSEESGKHRLSPELETSMRSYLAEYGVN